MYDRNIIIILGPNTGIWKQVMSNLPFPFPELAERTYIPSSWSEFGNITKYKLLKKVFLRIFNHVEPTFKNIILLFYREHMHGWLVA